MKNKKKFLIIWIVCSIVLIASAIIIFKVPNKLFKGKDKKQNANKTKLNIDVIYDKVYDLQYYLTQYDFDINSKDTNYTDFFILFMSDLETNEDGSIEVKNLEEVYKKYFDLDKYSPGDILNYFGKGVLFKYDSDQKKLIPDESELTDELLEEAERSYLTPYSYYTDVFYEGEEIKDDEVIIKAKFIINTKEGKFYKSYFDLRNHCNSYYEINREDGLTLYDVEKVYEEFKKELPVVTIKFKLTSYGEYVFDEVSAEP